MTDSDEGGREGKTEQKQRTAPVKIVCDNWRGRTPRFDTHCVHATRAHSNATTTTAANYTLKCVGSGGGTAHQRNAPVRHVRHVPSGERVRTTANILSITHALAKAQTGVPQWAAVLAPHRWSLATYTTVTSDVRCSGTDLRQPPDFLRALLWPHGARAWSQKIKWAPFLPQRTGTLPAVPVPVPWYPRTGSRRLTIAPVVSVLADAAPAVAAAAPAVFTTASTAGTPSAPDVTAATVTTIQAPHDSSLSLGQGTLRRREESPYHSGTAVRHP